MIQSSLKNACRRKPETLVLKGLSGTACTSKGQCEKSCISKPLIEFYRRKCMLYTRQSFFFFSPTFPGSVWWHFHTDGKHCALGGAVL